MAVKTTAADRRWAKEVKARDRYICQRCGKAYPEGHRGIQAAHIFTRSRKATRLDPDNGLALCTGCHWWGHRNPHEFTEFVKDYMGEEKYEDLQKRSKPRG